MRAVSSEKHPNCGWTETHAMFAYMGGFRLVSEAEFKQLQLHDEFFNNVINGVIEIPTIQEDEIQDRSKGDSVAKVIVVIQTLWFGIQAAHRVSTGFDVTKLEITTIGHVILNIFVLFFWWNKPLNVRFPIGIYLKKKSKGVQAPSLGEIDAPNEDLSRTTGQELESQIPLRPSLPFRVRTAALRYKSDGLSQSFLVRPLFFSF
jgi:hypothetical protein